MDIKKLSKTMAYALRHKPEEFGLSVEKGGWVSSSALASALTKRLKFKVTVADLQQVAADDDKGRYTLRGQKIRAAQGHSFPVELGLLPSAPPATLYHGTVAKNLDFILTEGLRPMSREHVHLSSEMETAIIVGSRYGEPVLLEIHATAAFEAGVSFMQADNGVWLATEIPKEFITVQGYHPRCSK